MDTFLQISVLMTRIKTGIKSKKLREDGKNKERQK
jgi:hypothetical protein